MPPLWLLFCSIIAKARVPIHYREQHYGLCLGASRYGTLTACADDPDHVQYRKLRTQQQSNASQNSAAGTFSSKAHHENVARCSLYEIQNTLIVFVLGHDLWIIMLHTGTCDAMWPKWDEKGCSSHHHQWPQTLYSRCTSKKCVPKRSKLKMPYSKSKPPLMTET
jgi:hypothetical protein